MTLTIEFQPLHSRHERERFDCGVPSLDEWLRRNANQGEKRGLSRTWIAGAADPAAWIDAGFDIRPSTILGFFSLSAGQAIGEALPARRVPRAVPIARLGRLAVDRRFQGQGLGEALLMEAIARTLSAAVSIGVAGLFVDAKDEQAAAFYRKYGFEPCVREPLKLWTPLGPLLRLLED